jgi:mercuric ion binding protein
MKLKSGVLFFIFYISGFSIMAQANMKTDTLKVYGNCIMCKANIEHALKQKDGIISKSWDTKTKMLFVTYDPSKISIRQVGNKIAEAGYDNQYATAPDNAYNKLQACCKYERPKK